MTFYVQIETGNDAMLDGRDIADALRVVASKVSGIGNIDRHGEDTGNRIGDLNGNKVGEWGISE